MGRTPLPTSPESTLPIKAQPGVAPDPRQPHYSPRFQRWFSWLVPTIIFANFAIFVLSMYINNCPARFDDCCGANDLGRFAFQSLRENPLLGPSTSTLLNMGAMDVKKVVEDREVWRLLSCMWLHAGVVHIFANMLSLLFVGIRLEQEFGFARVGLLYVISGVGGSLVSSLFVRDNISVGASGALFGFLGGMLSELITNWTIYESKLATLSSLLVIILINMAVGILPHVDNFAHLGGFLTGFLLGFVLMIRAQHGWVNVRNMPAGYRANPKYKAYQCLLLIIALIILTAGFTVGLTLLLRGVDGNNHCSWCHYLTCVPTPLWNCDARCTAMQMHNEVNLTCMHNQKSLIYTLKDGVNNTAQIEKLCVHLCL